jgi:protein-S-isoprenylcysteine O-methyltransferase Ste14
MSMAGPALAVLAVAAYAALHSVLASLGAKAQARRLVGPAADRMYRLGFNLVGVLTLMPVLAVPLVEPGHTLYAFPWPWAGILVAGQIGAAIVVLIGVSQTDPWHFLGVRQLVERESGRQATLVTTGLYRYVRHPLYTAGAAFLWLTPIMTTTLLALYSAFTAYLYLGSLHEERRLRAEFGEAYADYQRRVPRMIPRLRTRPATPPD